MVLQESVALLQAWYKQEPSEQLTGLASHGITLLAHDALKVHRWRRQAALIALRDLIQRPQKIRRFMLIAVGLILAQRLRLLGKQAAADLVPELQPGNGRAHRFDGFLALALDKALAQDIQFDQ